MSMSRRGFLRATLSGGGALIVCAAAGPALQALDKAAEPEDKQGTALIPLLEMSADGSITFINSRSDMGQGAATSLAQMLLDEMDADWDKLVAVKEGLAQRDLYEKGPFALVTVGAISMFFGWHTHRKAGASLRHAFKAAAARRWQVGADRLQTGNSVVTDPVSSKRFSYHELIADVASMELPDDAPLKTREQARIVGKPVPQVRARERVTGEALYGMDVDFPGLKTAMVERPPVFGGKIRRFDKRGALAVSGVVAVVEVTSGVAVIADTFWAAQKGRAALKVEWENGPFEQQSSQSIAAQLTKKLDTPDDKEDVAGNAGSVFAASNVSLVEGRFSFPFVAHATMEPMNCTAWVTDNSCEIWAPTQNKIYAVATVAEMLGRDEADITLHTTLMGGGFGRRAQEDFVNEAAEVSQKSGFPVKVVWTREDDMRHDYYRSMAEIRIRSGLDKNGKLHAWESGVSMIDTAPFHFVPLMRNNPEARDIGYAGQKPAYAIPHLHLSQSFTKLPITVGILRGISHGYTNLANEVMIDRLAGIAGRDPLDLRAEMLRDNPRAALVIEKLQQLASRNPVPKSMSRGFAFAYEGNVQDRFQYYSGHIADVGRNDDGTWFVHKIWIVADHGRVINPSGFRRQVEGAIVFALSMLRGTAITVDKGAVVEGNFGDYPLPTISDTPKYVEIELIDNDEWPMGVGEKMQAGIQPAIINALEKLSDTNIGRLPIADQLS